MLTIFILKETHFTALKPICISHSFIPSSAHKQLKVSNGRKW